MHFPTIPVFGAMRRVYALMIFYGVILARLAALPLAALACLLGAARAHVLGVARRQLAAARLRRARPRGRLLRRDGAGGQRGRDAR